MSRERKYLTFLEAPPIEASRKFIGQSIAWGHPHFVALYAIAPSAGAM